jgi:short-subunit dehydrogenase
MEEHVRALSNLAMLVHAAGFGTTGSFITKDVGSQVDMVLVHDVAAVRLTRAAIPAMIARHQGAIVHVSSIAAWSSAPGNVTYSATKAFLNTFCEGLQAELAGSGVRVQALCPGFTITEFHDTEEFTGFRRSALPRSFWMAADDVVAQSLKALRTNQVIVVPGLMNRAYVELARYGTIRAVARRFVRIIRARAGIPVRR